MGRNKKSDYIPRSFESNKKWAPLYKGKPEDKSSNIHYSMLMSNAWHNLTGKQKELYLYCKLQLFGQSIQSKENLKTEKEIDEKAKVDISIRFVFNMGLWCDLYGLYTEKTQRYFYSDMDALIENGFIKLIVSGKTTRTKNIYEFSDKWTELGKYEKDKKR